MLFLLSMFKYFRANLETLNLFNTIQFFSKMKQRRNNCKAVRGNGNDGVFFVPLEPLCQFINSE